MVYCSYFITRHEMYVLLSGITVMTIVVNSFLFSRVVFVF